MKITIHPTLKRPWGCETPYTCVDDDGKVYDGFIPGDRIGKPDILQEVEAVKKREIADAGESVEDLKARKAELEAELSGISARLAIAKEEKTVTTLEIK